MEDLIKRDDAISKTFCSSIDGVPRMVVLLDDIKAIPSADRPSGEWIERGIFHNADDDPIIEDWQSARCSVCHRYHTTPYMYYFDNYNFCPMCGTDMRERKESE